MINNSPPKPKKLNPSNSSPSDNIKSGRNHDQVIFLCVIVESNILKRLSLYVPNPKAKVSITLTSKYPTNYIKIKSEKWHIKKVDKYLLNLIFFFKKSKILIELKIIKLIIVK